MNILEIVISSVLYLILLSVGIYVIIQSPTRKSVRWLGITLLIGAFYILSDVITTQSTHLSAVRFWFKACFITAHLCILACFLAAFEFSIEEKLHFFSSKVIRWFMIIYSIVLIFMLSTTNIIIDYSRPIINTNNVLPLQFFINKLYFLRIFLIFIQLLYVSSVSFQALRKEQNMKLKVFFRIFFLSSLFLFFGANFGVLQLYLMANSNSFVSKLPFFVQNSILLLSTIIIVYALFHKTLINELYKATKEFLDTVGLSIIFSILYAAVIILITIFFDNDTYLLLLTLSLSGLILITHSTNEWLIEIYKNFIKNKVISIPKFLTSDVTEALKYYNQPNLLEGNRLLKSAVVKKIAAKNRIGDIEAFRLLISEAINYFSPKDTSIKRTAPRLRYEILKMLAFEDACESQIMWDLGFDVYTKSRESKISEFHEPRFKVSKSNEYSATSDRSFKRLRKEAIEMLKWRLTILN